MNNVVADSESSLRLGIFLSLFILLALLEYCFPRRKLSFARIQRWPSNLGLSILNTVFMRIVMPIAGVAGAQIAQQNGWGLFNIITLPSLLSVFLFLLIFDLAIYFQHRLFHYLPWLWRLHRMHHSDLDYDITTGSRFHPGSIFMSGLIKLALVMLLGAPVIAIVIAEILLNGTSMFNHSNIRLPIKFEKKLRWFIVTPDMHRVHHSIDEHEHNCNFGFNFPWWDRLFGSYLAAPKMSQTQMTLGLKGFQEASQNKLLAMLLQPFTSK